MPTVKEYSNKKVTVVWKPDLCIHSKKCFKGLPSVFDPNARPWIDVTGANSEAIVEQVGKCPSGALSIKNAESDTQNEKWKVDVVENGPLIINQPVIICTTAGEEQKEKTALCRCGASENKPYCDGSHKKVQFKG
ncbi:(4Fe-4S)-binding protein [Marinoscillum furvescens]|uniref:CDGSH-type Zn-finger protein n=1 Tax=Marinoscillum furvescens DSM 4134 TaxID=1122208 RepID=A0A3D9L1B2_MARFU|nr:(4Fe-4S)-binding protein [Marinoscillum furvescens]RED97533.1 CDGSH-type Zn-finger protein [Marinoscillum furvescens DSM 4134]